MTKIILKFAFSLYKCWPSKIQIYEKRSPRKYSNKEFFFKNKQLQYLEF